MTKFTPSLTILAALLALGLDVAPVQALNTRSFIASTGNDANACTRAAPCRTLQKAHDSTANKGEINVLDPAGYGTLTITKSISIVNDGVGSAGILVPSGGDGITITAGANDIINLRGLIIEGASIGNNGVVFNTGASLSIENCVFHNLASNGISFAPAFPAKLFVLNTFIGDSSEGINIFAGTAAQVVINRVELHHNGFGISASGSISGVDITVTDSIAANSWSGAGVLLSSIGSQTPLNIMMTRFTSSNNGSGLNATGAGITVTLTQSTLTANLVAGFNIVSGAIIRSYGDNYINANGPNVGFLTTLAKQ
jgi:hypothetical protein